MEDEEEIVEKLADLKREHKDLDEIIDKLITNQLQRLKKRKLMLKDMIQKIESDLLPDIIA
jgi:hypothetical protein